MQQYITSLANLYYRLARQQAIGYSLLHSNIKAGSDTSQGSQARPEVFIQNAPSDQVAEK